MASISKDPKLSQILRFTSNYWFDHYHTYQLITLKRLTCEFSTIFRTTTFCTDHIRLGSHVNNINSSQHNEAALHFLFLSRVTVKLFPFASLHPFVFHTQPQPPPPHRAPRRTTETNGTGFQLCNSRCGGSFMSLLRWGYYSSPWQRCPSYHRKRQLVSDVKRAAAPPKALMKNPR